MGGVGIASVLPVGVAVISDNIYRGKVGAFGTYWGQSSPLPQSPLQLALGGVVAFAADVGVLILSYQ